MFPTRATQVLLVVTIAIFSAATVSAAIIKGTAHTKMATIRATKQNGSPDPARNAACRSKFSGLIGKVATTSYTIDTKTLMMSANTKFETESYALSALGLAGSYSFGKFFNPSQPPRNLYAVLFSLNLQGKNPVNTFVYDLDKETNCVVSSAANPFKTAAKPRFGHGS
jgi:hypothetical protein